MRKRDELNNPAGCMAKAFEDEMTFVLLGRDLAAPYAIRAWIAERIRLGKNQPCDPQIVEAEECARIMGVERSLAKATEAQSHHSSLKTCDRCDGLDGCKAGICGGDSTEAQS